MTQPTHEPFVGQSIPRGGDRRLLIGAGRFVDDIRVPGTVHAAFVRSPHAHALVRAIDSTAALAHPGVLGVWTGAEVAALLRPQVVEGGELLPGRRIERWPLATDRVRFVGDPVAVVVATDRYVARDAAALVSVEYEPLSAVIEPGAASAPEAPLIHEGWPDNTAFRWEVVSGEPDRRLAGASRVVEVELINNRIQAAFIETRAVLASPQPGTDELTVWASTQVPHTVRGGIATALGLPEAGVRVIAPDIGGAFGTKGGVYPEYLLIPALARRLDRPVTWMETRGESFQATNHARDQHQHLRAAVAPDGTVEALEVAIVTNLGAYTASTTAISTGRMATGPYRVRDLRVTVSGVMTNTTPTGSYRGAGRPEAAYALERLMDAIGRELGIDPFEVRRRNALPPEAFPYNGPTGVRPDSGDYGRTLDEARRLIDYSAFRREQEAARERGELLGLGIALYCEFAGPGWDSAQVRAQPDGTVTIAVGVSPHGQGTETAFAQIAADTLGIDPAQIVVRSGDTAITPQGIGTFGSRNTVVGGSATLLAAREVAEKARRVAAALLEADETDIILDADGYGPRGVPDRRVTFAQIARAAHRMGNVPGGLPPGLEATVHFTPEGRTFPFGVHIAIVAIDRATGELTVRRYLAVDDCGVRINPRLIADQVRGGLAQGFGQALQEQIAYDADGQLLTGTFLDYALPRAEQLPNFELGHTVTPSPFNPLGVKGIGEAGTTGAPPALVNAALDALAPLGVRHLDMPLTAERIWRAMQASTASKR
jgi:carbon-monoxide dehydrogenase large subunit